jgi:hypothetical protein
MLPRVVCGGQTKVHKSEGSRRTRCSGAMEVQQRTAPARGLLLVPEVCKCMSHGAMLGAVLYAPSVYSMADSCLDQLSLVVVNLGKHDGTSRVAGNSKRD